MQADALSHDQALGLATWLLMASQPRVAFVVIMCWAGLLRASEALQLTAETLLRTKTGYLAILGRTKRGLEQKVEIVAPSLVAWVDHYRRRVPQGPGSIAGIKYGKLQYWIKKGMDMLGFPGRWTSHGLRRGAATHLYQQGMQFKDLMIMGRWLSERSAHEYIRRGEVQQERMRADIGHGVWMNVARLAAIGPKAWENLDLAVDKDWVVESRAGLASLKQEVATARALADIEK
jgi:integrase